jgi:hypothetical protein
MSDTNVLDKTHHFVLKKMVDTGQAPHYTEIAADLGVSPEEGRKTMHQLFESGVYGWMYPNTDFIASYAPFNNQPTQFRISVDGEQKWFAQWAFESLAVSWLFPGKTVRIDSPCLDCGDPISIEMKDGIILKANPEGMIGYVSLPVSKWQTDVARAWSTMVFFRSEEHLQNWAQYDPGTKDGISTVEGLLAMFSTSLFKRRLDTDYISNMKTYLGELIGEIGNFEGLGIYMKS